MRLGAHLLPDTPRNGVCPWDPLHPGVPKTLEDVENRISVPSNGKLIKTQGEKPPSGPSKTAKQVDTSDSNLCEFKSSTKIGLITWEQCISPVLQISSLAVHFFFFPLPVEIDNTSLTQNIVSQSPWLLPGFSTRTKHIHLSSMLMGNGLCHTKEQAIQTYTCQIIVHVKRMMLVICLILSPRSGK